MFYPPPQSHGGDSPVGHRPLAAGPAAWQGYTGWQDNGDRPMVFRAEAVFNAGRLHPLLAFEHGIRDYPFNRFRIGLGYTF